MLSLRFVHSRPWLLLDHGSSSPNLPSVDNSGSESTIGHLRRVLAHVAAEVNEEYVGAKKKFQRRPLPLQSAIDLNVVQLSTPSTSTIQNQSESAPNDEVDTMAAHGTSTISSRCQLELGSAFVEHGDEYCGGETVLNMPPAAHLPGPTKNCELTPTEVPMEIAISEGIPDLASWLHMTARFSSFPETKLRRPQEQRFVAGSLSLEPISGSGYERTLHLLDMPFDEELVISTDAIDAQHELSFVLIGAQQQEVRVRWRWHM